MFSYGPEKTEYWINIDILLVFFGPLGSHTNRVVPCFALCFWPSLEESDVSNVGGGNVEDEKEEKPKKKKEKKMKGKGKPVKDGKEMVSLKQFDAAVTPSCSCVN